MNDRLKRLFKIYDVSQNAVSDESIDPKQEHLNKAQSSIYSPGPSFQVIFDFPSRSFQQVSADVEKVLGYPADEFTIEKLILIIHPDDIESVLKNEALGGVFLNKYLIPSERPYYKATYQYRVLHSNGDYKLILHQAIPLTSDSEGNISRTFLNCSDISKYTDTSSKKISFIDIRGIKSYTNIDVSEDLKEYFPEEDLLSTREMEVLHLISEGYNSKEIAEMLFISYDTVRTHRNNIISKNDFKSINQAVAYYIRHGLL